MLPLFSSLTTGASLPPTLTAPSWLGMTPTRTPLFRASFHATGQPPSFGLPRIRLCSHIPASIWLSAVTDAMQVVEWPSGRSLYTLKSPPGGTSAIAFSRDDSHIAVAGTDGILRIYDSSSGKLVAQNEDLLGESFAIDFSADGRQVVAG